MDHFIKELRRVFGDLFRRRQPPDVTRIPDRPAPRRDTRHEENETAHHEAGHALTAWYSPYTLNLLELSILPGKAFVKPAIVNTGTPHQLYEWTVICLGGMAGVLRIRDLIRSGYFLTDLEQARDVAERLAGMGRPIPLKHHAKARNPGLDLERMFRKPMSRRTAVILNDALEEARRRLDEHPDPFERLVQALLKRKTLTATDLPAVLGPRPWAPGG